MRELDAWWNEVVDNVTIVWLTIFFLYVEHTYRRHGDESAANKRFTFTKILYVYIKMI
jgi:hypothetical protein